MPSANGSKVSASANPAIGPATPISNRATRDRIGELVVEQRVGDDVMSDLADRGTTPRLNERVLVDDEVERLADMDVVERRSRQVHGQVPRPVARILLEQRVV